MGAPTKDQAGKNFARRKVEAVFEGFSIKDNYPMFPKFEKAECKLGKGGLVTVYEIRSFTVSGQKVSTNKKGFSDDLDETEYEVFSGAGHADSSSRENRARMFIAEHCLRNNSDARYALKILSPETTKDQGMFVQGMMDMVLETRFMSDIEHTNIVKIRAMAKGCPYDANFFLIMDRLYDNLERRIQKVWLPKDKRQKRF